MIKKWRTAIGNTKVSRVKYSSPEALRHDFGVSGTVLKIKKWNLFSNYYIFVKNVVKFENSFSILGMVFTDLTPQKLL